VAKTTKAFDISSFLGSEKRIKRGLEAAQLVLWSELVRQTPSVTGQLRDAWRRDKIVFKKGKPIQQATVSNSKVYLQPVNRGTKPPHGPYGKRGVKRVSAWARRKLGLNKKESINFAFAYRAKLYKTGMLTSKGGNKGYNFIEKAEKIAQPRALDKFLKAFDVR